MGSRPKAPDNSAQIAAANQQSAELSRQQEEQRIQKEALALKNTQDLTAKRRSKAGRGSLITTSEQGLTESNALGT